MRIQCVCLRLCVCERPMHVTESRDVVIREGGQRMENFYFYHRAMQSTTVQSAVLLSLVVRLSVRL